MAQETRTVIQRTFGEWYFPELRAPCGFVGPHYNSLNFTDPTIVMYVTLDQIVKVPYWYFMHRFKNLGFNFDKTHNGYRLPAFLKEGNVLSRLTRPHPQTIVPPATGLSTAFMFARDRVREFCQKNGMDEAGTFLKECDRWVEKIQILLAFLQFDQLLEALLPEIEQSTRLLQYTTIFVGQYAWYSHGLLPALQEMLNSALKDVKSTYIKYSSYHGGNAGKQLTEQAHSIRYDTVEYDDIDFGEWCKDDRPFIYFGALAWEHSFNRAQIQRLYAPVPEKLMHDIWRQIDWSIKDTNAIVRGAHMAPAEHRYIQSLQNSLLDYTAQQIREVVGFMETTLSRHLLAYSTCDSDVIPIQMIKLERFREIAKSAFVTINDLKVPPESVYNYSASHEEERENPSRRKKKNRFSAGHRGKGSKKPSSDSRETVYTTQGTQRSTAAKSAQTYDAVPDPNCQPPASKSEPAKKTIDASNLGETLEQFLRLYGYLSHDEFLAAWWDAYLRARARGLGCFVNDPVIAARTFYLTWKEPEQNRRAAEQERKRMMVAGAGSGAGPGPATMAARNARGEGVTGEMLEEKRASPGGSSVSRKRKYPAASLSSQNSGSRVGTPAVVPKTSSVEESPENGKPVVGSPSLEISQRYECSGDSGGLVENGNDEQRLHLLPSVLDATPDLDDPKYHEEHDADAHNDHCEVCLSAEWDCCDGITDDDDES